MPNARSQASLQLRGQRVQARLAWLRAERLYLNGVRAEKSLVHVGPADQPLDPSAAKPTVDLHGRSDLSDRRRSQSSISKWGDGRFLSK